MVASCEQSLCRLRVDHIDLYQVHFDDPGTSVEETVEALETLKLAGKIRHYGVGHLPLSRMEAYLDAGDVFSVLVELSAAARGARRRLMPLCRERGIGVFAFSVTGRGLLTGKIGRDHTFEEGDIRQVDPLFRSERLASALRLVERLWALGHEYDKTPVQVAVAWVLARPGILRALTGPSTIAHLEENLGGWGWEIAPQDLAELEQVFREEDERVRRQQARGIQAILTGDLDAESALAGLVYVFETLMEQGLAAKGELLPLFQDLWALRGQSDAEAVQRMRAIQAELRARVLPLQVPGEEELPDEGSKSDAGG